MKLPPRKEPPKEKTELHPRNKHRERYDFTLLVNTSPELQPFVKLNDYG
nr:RlmF-related methyltransferase [Bacteroidota bacterium]